MIIIIFKEYWFLKIYISQRSQKNGWKYCWSLYLPLAFVTLHCGRNFFCVNVLQVWHLFRDASSEPWHVTKILKCICQLGRMKIKLFKWKFKYRKDSSWGIVTGLNTNYWRSNAYVITLIFDSTFLNIQCDKNYIFGILFAIILYFQLQHIASSPYM